MVSVKDSDPFSPCQSLLSIHHKPAQSPFILLPGGLTSASCSSASLLTAFLIPTAPVFGSAFSIFENGVRASGMGGAFVAIANDGSATFYNPAGITFQKARCASAISLTLEQSKPARWVRCWLFTPNLLEKHPMRRIFPILFALPLVSGVTSNPATISVR